MPRPEQVADACTAAPHDAVRAPLAGADDYSAAPARTIADGWDYEAQQPVAHGSAVMAAWRTQHAADTAWTGVVARRHGGAQREAVQLATGARVAFWAWPRRGEGR